MPLGRSIKLFMTDGSPSGVILADLSLFTGMTMTAPRASLSTLMTRPEVNRPGVYLLLGPDPTTAGAELVYIGETDSLSRRLAQHDASEQMEFFDRVCVIVSKDELLTRGHCLYLESSLIRMAKQAARVNVMNVQAPEPRGLPEPDVADMDGFLQQLGFMLPIVGFDVLRPPQRAILIDAAPELVNSPPQPTSFTYQINGASARMEKRGGEYVLLAGSTAALSEYDSISANVRAKRKQLQQNGVLVAEGLFLHLTTDVGFGSPSAASGLIAGRSDNGRQSWRQVGTGKNLNELEEWTSNEGTRSLTNLGLA